MTDFVYNLDLYLFRLANGAWASPWLDSLMPALSLAGDYGAVWLLLLGAIAAFGKGPGRRMALAGLIALAVGFVSAHLLKELIARPRPFLALEDARLLVGVPRTWAFPSGHATSAFAATAGVMLSARRLLGRLPLWSWGMLALAGAVAYSRLYVGVHWPTDVLAGMVLGATCGRVGARIALRRWKPARVAPEARGDTGEGREEEYASERR